MRKLLISLLLASAVATPALAAPDDNTDREQTRAERQQARDQARSERAAERAQPSSRPERVERVVEPRPQALDVPARAQITGRSDARDVRVEQRQERIQGIRDSRDLRQSSRPLPNVMRTRTPVVSPVPREGTQPPPPPTASRNTPQPQWSTNWRHNHNYDWYNWRNRHRSLFRLGFYYDPFGWGYQPYSIGWRLWPSYYRSSFWISDPWQYRLPYAPAGTRWVRYYDDALLVDMWSGQVVDVIYNFFW